MGWISRLANKSAENAIIDYINSDKFSDAVDGILYEISEKNIDVTPDRGLSELGFHWCLFVALRRHWPDVDKHDSVNWLMAYIGVPYGTYGYDWTGGSAKYVAQEYAEQFGENT
jgi:hypothetical protein